MNQAAEMSAFIDWLEINPLEPTTQTLWFHLMMIANKSGFPEWFTVANPLLQAKVGCTENTLNKHRNYLVQKGRIEYRSNGKQKAGKYRLIHLTTANNEVNREVKREVKYEVKHEVKHEVKGAALFKDLSSSASSTSSSPIDANLYESYYAAHIRVFGFECNPFQAKQLGSYIDDDGLDESVIVRAIERAGAAAVGYNFSLIRRIVDDYFKSGARTLQQAIALDEAFEARKQQPIRGGSVHPPQRSAKKSFADIGRGMTGEQRRDGAPV